MPMPETATFKLGHWPIQRVIATMFAAFGEAKSIRGG
jgi:hypothetical protein